MSVVNISGDGLFDFASSIIGRVWPDPDAQAKAQLELLRLRQSGELAQLQVNGEEAKHESLFVAGWRPFIGWTCGAAFAYTFVLQPFLVFLASLTLGFDAAGLPTLDMTDLIAVLGGMLGLGWMRTAEKMRGVNTNRFVPPTPQG